MKHPPRKTNSASIPSRQGIWTIVAVTVLLALPAFAQYSIDWFSIDGGGGTSSGGDYSLTGTIGQADAGPAMVGEDYSLTGGFLSVVTVIQTVDAPRLSIVREGADVIVSWPAPSTDWRLEQKNVLTSPTWSGPTESITDDGSTRSVRVSSPTGNRYYRLSKP